MKKWICLLMSLLVLMSVFPAYALSGDELPQDAEKNRRALFVTGNKEKETDPGPEPVTDPEPEPSVTEPEPSAGEPGPDSLKGEIRLSFVLRIR